MTNTLIIRTETFNNGNTFYELFDNKQLILLAEYGVRKDGSVHFETANDYLITDEQIEQINLFKQIFLFQTFETSE